MRRTWEYDSKIYKGLQRAKNRQKTLEKIELGRSSFLNTIIHRQHGNPTRAKWTNGKSTDLGHLWILNMKLAAPQSNSKRIPFSINGVWTTGYTYKKNKIAYLLCIIYKSHFQVDQRPTCKRQNINLENHIEKILYSEAKETFLM